MWLWLQLYIAELPILGPYALKRPVYSILVMYLLHEFSAEIECPPVFLEVLWQCCVVSCHLPPVREEIVQSGRVRAATGEERSPTWATYSLLFAKKFGLVLITEMCFLIVLVSVHLHMKLDDTKYM